MTAHIPEIAVQLNVVGRAGMIRQVIKQKYIHVVLSMDAELEEAYSVGRRNPAVPLFAGFEKEDKRKILTLSVRLYKRRQSVRNCVWLCRKDFIIIMQLQDYHLFCGTFHFTRKTITPVLPTWHGY